ncbi:lysosomal alpha-glucosidase-like, partial [Hyposmocoma kahamanoa]|uniref:lysosomal alpha-glucosidase-like n=1 Tax=Hyposmocoma kahamanoa TaxID=1477025 RepID=UPI000E6D9E55
MGLKLPSSRYQRFSENRNVFRRLWDNFPGLGSTALAVALVIALAVGVWWVVCGALGTSWGDHHYKKLWERAHPDNIKKPLSPIPFEKPPVTEYTNSNRYHDHNNLSTKNKNVSAEVPKKKEALKKYYNTIPLEKMDQVCGNVSVKMRFDCSPGAGQDVCEKRGCCWRPTKVRGAPFCYYPPQYNTFRFLNMTENKHGMRVYYERWRPSGYPDDWTYAVVDFKYLSEDMLRIKIYDPENKRFEVPVPQVPIVSGPIWNMKFKVVVNSSGVGFKVVRLLDAVPIINMQDIGAWILSDKMLQVSFKIPTHHVFGIGEHRVRFERDMNWKTYTLFNRDIMPMDNMNLYGSHPFHMAVEITGKTSGMLLHNSNAMDVVFQPTPAITYRSTGGVLDFFVFVGPTPKDVISQLTTIIGRPFMPPYWSLGMHLCKYGYKDLNYTRAVWKRNREAGIPFDVQWNDIDYMKNSNDFTINPERFSDLPKFVEEVHNAGMHYVMLFDPGVSAAEKPGTYPPFDRGLDMDVFVKNRTNQPFIAKVCKIEHRAH